MADPVDIVTLDQARAFLNIRSDNDDVTFQLGEFISAASQMWVQRVGPVSATAYTETHDGGSSRIVLRHTPVQSVTSIVESYGSTVRYTLTEQDLAAGTSVGPWGYTIDKPTGTVTRRAAGVAVPFATGQRNVTVQYEAGYESVPADIKHAVLLLVLHLWQTQRGAGKMPGGTDDWQPQFAFTWPSRVEEIAAGYRIPGIA